MREIEIKARVTDIEALRSTLISKGIKLSSPIKQHDRVYGEPNKQDNELNANWLRIRTENDTKHLFTLKKSVVGHLDSTEHETEVIDAVELENIIRELHYEPYSDLTKTRQKGHCGKIEICLDEVPGLGIFIEAELLMDSTANHDDTVAELWKLLESFGIDKKDEVHEGYDVLERKQRGL